jgi:hypothetical protein
VIDFEALVEEGLAIQRRRAGSRFGAIKLIGFLATIAIGLATMIPVVAPLIVPVWFIPVAVAETRFRKRSRADEAWLRATLPVTIMGIAHYRSGRIELRRPDHTTAELWFEKDRIRDVLADLAVLCPDAQVRQRG